MGVPFAFIIIFWDRSSLMVQAEPFQLRQVRPLDWPPVVGNNFRSIFASSAAYKEKHKINSSYV